MKTKSSEHGILRSFLTAALVLICILASSRSAEAAIQKVRNLKTVQTGERFFTLSWNQVSDADGYLIYCRNTATGRSKTFQLKENKAIGGKVTYRIGGCRYCTRYRIRVAAYKGNRRGAYSERTIAITKLIVPETPSVWTASEEASNVILKWKKVSYAHFYEIYSGSDEGKVYLGKTSGKKVALTGLTAGKTVTLYVRAVREKAGNRAESGFGEVTLTPIDREAGLRLANEIDDRDVYTWGEGNRYINYSREQLEAYANYKNGGGPFNSYTNYFVMVNTRSCHMYVYKRSGIPGKTWELLYSWPCIIGASWTPTSRGNYRLHRSYSIHYYSYNYALYCTSYAGLNMIHSLLFPQQADYLDAGYRASMGCIRLQSSAAKFIYDYCDGASMIVR